MAEAHVTIRADLEPMRTAFAAFAASIERTLHAYAPLLAEVRRQHEWVMDRG